MIWNSSKVIMKTDVAGVGKAFEVIQSVMGLMALTVLESYVALPMQLFTQLWVLGHMRSPLYPPALQLLNSTYAFEQVMVPWFLASAMGQIRSSLRTLLGTYFDHAFLALVPVFLGWALLAAKTSIMALVFWLIPCEKVNSRLGRILLGRRLGSVSQADLVLLAQSVFFYHAFRQMRVETLYDINVLY
jgi:hypothetical protein